MKRLLILITTFVCVIFSAQAKVVLPKVLGSNMVLQQQSEVNLWGKAKPKAKITVNVSWNDVVYQSVADKRGEWSVKIATPAVTGFCSSGFP